MVKTGCLPKTKTHLMLLFIKYWDRNSVIILNDFVRNIVLVSMKTVLKHKRFVQIENMQIYVSGGF